MLDSAAYKKKGGDPVADFWRVLQLLREWLSSQLSWLSSWLPGWLSSQLSWLLSQLSEWREILLRKWRGSEAAATVVRAAEGDDEEAAAAVPEVAEEAPQPASSEPELEASTQDEAVPVAPTPVQKPLKQPPKPRIRARPRVSFRVSVAGQGTRDVRGDHVLCFYVGVRTCGAGMWE